MDIKEWMNKNKRNEEITELLVIGDCTCHCQVKKELLTFGLNAVPFQTSAKYLGVHLHEMLSMKEQVTSLCCSSCFHFNQTIPLRWKYCPVSLLSYPNCSSTLSGLPPALLNWLQKVQNNAARLVLHKQKSDHVTSLLKKLHWLPVDAHIHYKIATLAFRHFENSLPLYLSELLHTYQPSWTVRSSNEKLLKVPKTKSVENRSFHFEAAKIWNSLPITVHISPSVPSFKNNNKQTNWKHIFLLLLLWIRQPPSNEQKTDQRLCCTFRGSAVL